MASAFIGTASGDALPYHARAMASLGVELPVADRVLVKKAERRLYLMRGNDVLRAYRVALGLNPVSAKERAGDFRTPEGSYRLTRNFDVTAGVRYTQERDRLAPVVDTAKQDSQAVYIGTQFHF